MKIQPVSLGLPAQTGTDLLVRVISFDTDATTCSLYYEVRTENSQRLAEGNINLTEEEFARWGFNNTYIEDIALEKLGLTRAPETKEAEKQKIEKLKEQLKVEKQDEEQVEEQIKESEQQPTTNVEPTA
jgi:hypothetical protein